ncbi:MAG: NAD(P)/FAD-dependent oxidoreductase [Candidatus Thermoplasmatota archaeon]|nr:NAD(P)/FAD-dependent oxidoreductase [Candidatus Thermoplasmatota archaeon]
MVQKKKRTVCIIGAGIGGLTAGALLAQHRWHVKIFEKESVIGGRALTLDMSSLTINNYKEMLANFQMHIPFSEPSLEAIFQNNLLQGYHLDLGFHVFGGGITDNIKQATPDAFIDMIRSKLYTAKQGNPYLFATTTDKIKIIPNLLRLFLSGETTMSQLDNVSIKDMIKRYGNGKTKIILELNSRLITTVNNLDFISAGEVLRTQKKMKLRGVRYPKQGIKQVCRTLAESITKHGGELHLNNPVTKIHIEGGKATGILAKGKNHCCDAVVSTVLVQQLFTIAEKNHFPKDYVQHLQSLEGTGSLCAYYALTHVDKKVIGKNFVFIERNVGVDGKDAAGMVDLMSALPESGLAPPKQHLVQSYVICNPKEAQHQKTLEKLKEILDAQLENIVPDFRQHLKWAIYPAIRHLDGVAKTIENEKPDIKTPIDQLYLIGDCVKAPGIGLNCAMNSARLLQDVLIEK